MASIANDPRGRKRILFITPDGNRKAIRLGKASIKQAEALKVKIEQHVTAKITGVMDDETARWVATLDEVIHARLVTVGLVAKREKQSIVTLGGFIVDYIASRTDIKPGTRVQLKQASAN